LSLIAAAAAEGIVFVRDGTPRASIVVPKAASPTERFGAEEMPIIQGFHMNAQRCYPALSVVVVLVLAGFTTAAEDKAATDEVKKVSSASELTETAKRAEPGDVIVVSNGRYNGWRARISCKGNENQPIVIQPETVMGVTFTGVTQLDITGSHIVMKGFRFDGCELKTTPVALNGAQYCSVTDCHFSDIRPGKSPSYAALWIQNNAADNRVDHCTFKKTVKAELPYTARTTASSIT